MRIGELSALTGVSQRSLRYYERQGLLVSTRSPSGQRHYDEGHVARIRLVQAFMAAGVPTRRIAEMVPCMVEPSTPRAHRALSVMTTERARIEDTIDSLTAARRALDDLIAVNRTYLADHADA